MERNPRAGNKVAVPSKGVPPFKPGKELRERLNLPDVMGADLRIAVSACRL